MSETELVKRLERLERDNRRLKRIALAALVLVAGAVGLGATYATPAVPQKILAHEFDVMDSHGKVRVKMAMNCLRRTDCWPSIDLYDQVGRARTSLGAGVLTISDPALSGGKQDEVTLLGDTIQFEKDGVVQVRLGHGQLWLFGPRVRNSILVDSGIPGIEIADSAGFTMDLGRSKLVTPATGETHQTSAASIVMFGNGKKHHVIWEAPQ